MLAIMILCYNEKETLGAVLKNWEGYDRYVFIGTKPWHWTESENDGSDKLAERLGAKVIKGIWTSETQQRNEALAMLYDYDYVLIVDADELYTEEDKKKIIDVLENGMDDPIGRRVKENCYRASKVRTYWKTTDYILDPLDRHKPIIAVNPKKILFKEFRVPDTDQQPTIDVTMHHLSYCKSDQKILEKINQFEHHNLIKPNWYEEKWLGWKPETEFIHPYDGKNRKAILNPLPEELKKLI